MNETIRIAHGGWLWLIVCSVGLHASCENAAPIETTASEDVTPAKPADAMAAARSVDSAAADSSSRGNRKAGTTPSDTPEIAQPSAAGAGVPQPTTGSSPKAGSGGPASESDDAGTLAELCSGCAEEARNAADMTVHLHHIHLNVKSRETSLQFYEKYFKAQRVLLNGTTEALQVMPTLLLLDERTTAPRGNLPTALQHMGWGTADTAGWYETAHAQGLLPDTRGFTLFNTNETPTVGEPGSGAIIALSGALPACFPVPDIASYMYVLGPDQERIEVWSGAEGRVNHVHFTTADLVASSAWIQKFLGLPSMTPLLSYQFFLDDILFFFEPIGAATDYENTDDHTLAHVAFSVTSLDAWRTRVTEQDVEVVREPAAAHGWKSFFVRGPDGLLIELVEAAKNPALCPQ